MTGRTEKIEKHIPSSEHFELEEFPFYWVARVNARYSLELEKTLKLLNMDVSRWRVAMLLKVYGELSISDIADHALGKLPTITKIVQRMNSEGLVKVYPSQLDGRVTLVTLTEKGDDNVEQILYTTQKLFKKAFKGFTEPQIRKMNLLLGRMLDNLSS